MALRGSCCAYRRQLLHTRPEPVWPHARCCGRVAPMETHLALRARLQLLGAITASAAGLVMLVRLGEASWARVGLRDPGAWLAVTPASDAVPAALRLVAIAGLGWVLASLLVAMVQASIRRAAALPASRGMPTRGQRWIWPPARRLVEQALGAALLVGAATPALASAPPPPGLAPPAVTVPAPSSGAALPMVGVEERPTPGFEIATSRPTPGARITVRPGDSLWRLAAAALGAAHGVDGDRLTPEAVTPYWLDVVSANRQRLRSGDPDVIHPGEVIDLPSLPAPSGGRPATAPRPDPPVERP